ncbi:MAG: hypothetical protein HC890_08200 [Chloroflexaceae bacterium]|nr:hypothetical protein [Chloroflexaceae bacterium]
MDTQNRARALMIRHHQLIKNRQQTMLNRAAAEIGFDIAEGSYEGTVQGKPNPSFRDTYDRSHASFS